ncbi:MAG: inositol monophosphatase [Candidatus Altiarchaeota archaeon]|nr:inositol monophosphatase [Candidatus Altiarchaeota archaeon]
MKSKELEAAIKAAREAGRIQLEKYGKVSLKYKKDKTIVTEADVESEERIIAILKKDFPDYSILGEESGLTRTSSDYMWVIDPLDGTTNYSVQNPFFDVSIALTRKSEPIMGVVYYPSQDEMFYAEKGRGAYMNDERIKVSNKEKIEESVLTFCHASDRESVEKMSNVWRTWKLLNPKVRQIGAGALEMAYVACGRTECFLMIKMNSWDVAAGTVLIREAGGKVTDLEGKEFTIDSTDILASNGRLHDKLLKLICSSI